MPFLSFDGDKLTEQFLKDKDKNLEKTYMKRHFVSFGDRFVLHPNSFVLGSTLEWIRVPVNMGGYVTGKSSWGRRGLIIETAAGIHPGFTGCLTLELTNVGEVPIALYPAFFICQVFFHAIQENILTDSPTPEIQDSPGAENYVRHIGFRRPMFSSIVPDDKARRLFEENPEN